MPASPIVLKKLPSRLGFEFRPVRVLSPSAQQALRPIISGLTRWATGTGLVAYYHVYEISYSWGNATFQMAYN